MDTSASNGFGQFQNTISLPGIFYLGKDPRPSPPPGGDSPKSYLTTIGFVGVRHAHDARCRNLAVSTRRTSAIVPTNTEKDRVESHCYYFVPVSVVFLSPRDLFRLLFRGH